MAQIEGRPELGLKIVLTITEEEARALDAMAGYGDDAFVEAFYAHLGKAYMELHEQGLRLFLKSLRETTGLAGILKRLDDARAVWSGEKKAVRP